VIRPNGWLLLAAVVAVTACDGPVVTRTPVVVPDIPGYGDELRMQELNLPEPPAPRPYDGPGGYVRWSPETRLAAVTTQARGDVQTINIWDSTTESLQPLISIHEMDPGSGRAYRYSWSRDGRMLLVYGNGYLADGSRKNNPATDTSRLCLIYDVQADTLYRIQPCTNVKWGFG
jgi:hypothetical protein